MGQLTPEYSDHKTLLYYLKKKSFNVFKFERL